MPRFRRAMSPINSIKHILDVEGALASGANSTSIFVNAVPNVDSTTFVPGNVRTGATVNGFFISVFVIGATGAPLNNSINWYIIKLHSGQSAALPTPGSTGGSLIRNQIIHEEKGLAGSGDGTPMAFKGVIVVPKGMRRMREGDEFIFVINSLDATNNATFCFKAIYKSYF